MTLIDVLPKDSYGHINLSPGAILEDGTQIDAGVPVEWFASTLPDLANAIIPITDAQYSALCALGPLWAVNVERWRSEGII